MDVLSIELPDNLKAFVQQEVTQGGYSSPAEYVCAVLEEARQRQSGAELEAILLAGFDPAGLPEDQVEQAKALYRARAL
ncbi:MAG: type II toxin-antitoxin system ParD family antitoxin [Gemmataceae bacterium]